MAFRRSKRVERMGHGAFPIVHITPLRNIVSTLVVENQSALPRYVELG